MIPDLIRNILLKFLPSHFIGLFEQLLRFGISGVTASLAALCIVYISTSFLHIWYLISSVLGFATAFVLAFLLQKFWTFKEKTMTHIHIQTAQSFVVATFNLGMNVILMYLLVEYVHLNYMIAQGSVYIVMGVLDFGIYKFLIFRARTSENTWY